MGQDFNLEKAANTLPLIPPVVAKAINGEEPSEARECEYVGKRISLSGKKPNKDWFAVSRNACDWAAGAAVGWIIRSTDSGYVVVLSLATTSIGLSQHKTKGLRDIYTVRIAERGVSKGTYKFDGVEYVEVTPKTAGEKKIR